MLRGKRLFLIKVVLGVSLLVALLLWNDNWRQVLQIFAGAEPVWVVPFFAISGLMIWTSCLKWGLFLEEQRVTISQPRLVSLYLIGIFFNNFLPSNVGGDIVRSYMLGRHIKSQVSAAASVFLERLTGFVAMVTIALVAFLFTPSLRQEPLVITAVAIMGGLCFAVLLVIFFPAPARQVLQSFSGIPFLRKLEHKIAQFHAYLVQFNGRGALIARAMAYSYLFYFFAVVNLYLGTKLLDVQVNFFQLLIITPIVMLVAALPLTPNSIGLWEWGFSVFLVSAGATSQEGLAVALALRAKNLTISLIGGLILLSGNRMVKEAREAATKQDEDESTPSPDATKSPPERSPSELPHPELSQPRQ